MKKIIALFTIFALLSPQMVFAQLLQPVETFDYENVVPQDAISQMAQAMLEHQEDPLDNRTSWSFEWDVMNTALNVDLNGGFNGAFYNSFLGNDLDILTGEVAIDESLQLGSIGEDRGFSSEVGDVEYFDIDEILPVDIRPHPWEEMVEGKKFDVPKISQLVPSDNLFVYFEEPTKYLELEELALDLFETFGTDLYTMASVTQLREKMMSELNLPNNDFLLNGLDEMAFISEDLSFVFGTDFALILKFKSSDLKSGFEFLKDKEVISTDLGDYTVVATNEEYLAKIKDTYVDEESRLSDEKDFHFMLASLESRRDGMVYLSESLIRKLTGPEYRINSRRRNTVVRALENLQYVSFAYLKITGEWPESISQIMDEGYIRKNSIYEEDKYFIEDGIVNHEEWGNIWEITPVNRVEIDEINAAEKDLYERFSEDYQSYFTEFFDPIGISFVISDKIMFHTLILPLIEQSEYNLMKAAFGSGADTQIDTIFDGRRLGAINFAAKFSIDEMFDFIEEEDGYDVRDDIAEEFGLESLDPLGFVGDEIFLGIGGDNTFSFNDLADLDVWFGFKLENQEHAEDFLKKVFEAFGSEYQDESFGLFSVSKSEPVRNVYNEVEYFLIPTGFVNIYYVFLDGNFYASVSQIAINRLIDSSKEDFNKDFDKLARNFSYIGDEHHVLATADFSKIVNWDSEAIEDEFIVNNWRIRNYYDLHKDYLYEAMVLAESLPDFDGTLENVEQYYRNIPETFMDGEFIIEDGEIYFDSKKAEKPYLLSEIADKFSNDETDKFTTIVELIDNENSVEEIKEKLELFESGALGFSFTPEGIEVKMSIGNPINDKLDDRFGSVNNELDIRYLDNRGRIFLFGSLAILVVLGVVVVVKFVRK